MTTSERNVRFDNNLSGLVAYTGRCATVVLYFSYNRVHVYCARPAAGSCNNNNNITVRSRFQRGGGVSVARQFVSSRPEFQLSVRIPDSRETPFTPYSTHRAAATVRRLLLEQRFIAA